MDSGGVDTGTAVAIALGGVLVGAIATGAFQIAFRFWDLRLAARVAARLVQGNAYVASVAFKMLIENHEWFDHDFGPAQRTWEEHRKDLAAVLSTPDWAEIGAFYDNLERSAAIARPREPASEGDIRNAEAMVNYANAATKVVIEFVPKGFRWKYLPKFLRSHLKRQREIDETVRRLGGQEAGAIEGLGGNGK